MRRGASIAVLVLLLAGVLAPLAQLTSSSLPACCRTGGQHHCMGVAGLDGFRNQAQDCPYRAFPAVISGMVALLRVNQSQAYFLARSNTVILAKAASLRPSFDTVQKRGPPQR